MLTLVQARRRPGVLQRKPGCGCGGSCPKCRDDRLALQPKLRVSEPGDAYEQEADRVADQVMRMPEAGVVAMHGGGRPLPGSDRGYFEPRFGRDVIQRQAEEEPEPSPGGCETDCGQYCEHIAAHYITTRLEGAFRGKTNLTGSYECHYHENWRSPAAPWIWACTAKLTVPTDDGPVEVWVFVKLTRTAIMVWDLDTPGRRTCGPICEYGWVCEGGTPAKLKLVERECVRRSDTAACNPY